MITETTMYWVTRLDNFLGLAIFGLIIGLLMVGATTIVSVVNYTNAETDDLWCKRTRWLVRIGVVLICASMLVMTFVPSTKEMCAIKIVPALANDTDIRELKAEAVKTAKDWLVSIRNDNKDN